MGAIRRYWSLGLRLATVKMVLECARPAGLGCKLVHCSSWYRFSGLGKSEIGSAAHMYCAIELRLTGDLNKIEVKYTSGSTS